MNKPIDPEQWLNNYGDDLYRYAFSRTSNQQVSEDLVQDTLLAAFESRDRFAYKSSEKTWLTGILKHKILDYFRAHYKKINIEINDSLTNELEQLYFNDKESWQYFPSGWSTQEEYLSNQDFWKTFNDCLNALPPHMMQLFLLREDGVSSKQLCKIFDIKTTNNIWVILSRTRMRLRHCLDSRWFNRSDNNNEE